MRLRVPGAVQRMAVILCIAGAFACFLFGAYVGLNGYKSLLGVGGTGSSQVDQARNHLSDLGNFGSFFQGPVASVWALAGVFLILATFINQEGQLSLQREALAEQQGQFKKQDEAATKQNFETSFFQLLNFQNTVAANMYLKGATPTSEFHGRICFLVLADLFKAEFVKRVTTSPERKSLPQVMTLYSEFYGHYQPLLGHYFRTLYHVFRFINHSEFSISDKRQYTSLVRAQLSSAELILLFYNCLSPYGEKFKPLVIEFGLLEHIDRETLLDPSHGGFYPASAYQ